MQQQITTQTNTTQQQITNTRKWHQAKEELTFNALLKSSSDKTIFCSLSKSRNKSISSTLFSLQYWINLTVGGSRGLGTLNPPTPPWLMLRWVWVSRRVLIVFSISMVIVMFSRSSTWKVVEEEEESVAASSNAVMPAGWRGFFPICTQRGIMWSQLGINVCCMHGYIEDSWGSLVMINSIATPMGYGWKPKTINVLTLSTCSPSCEGMIFATAVAPTWLIRLLLHTIRIYFLKNRDKLFLHVHNLTSSFCKVLFTFIASAKEVIPLSAKPLKARFSSFKTVFAWIQASNDNGKHAC